MLCRLRNSEAKDHSLEEGRIRDRDTGAAIERAGFTLDQLEFFDPMPRLVPTRPWLSATAR